jgi:TPR repeat protein
MPTSTKQPARAEAPESDEIWLAHAFKATRAQFDETKQLTDLGECIRLGTLLNSMTEESDPHRLERTHDLGCAHFLRYQAVERKSLKDLKEAVVLLQSVSDVSDDQYSNRGKLFVDLQLCLHHLYRKTDQVDYLNRSIQYGERARQLLADGKCAEENLLPKALSNLANAYHDRYDDLGRDPTNLDTSIDLSRQAVNATGPNDSQFSHRQEILGTALYTRRRSVSDLREAISLYTSAVEDKLVGASLRGRRLDNLGAAHFVLFQAYSHIDDLVGAIKYYSLAAAADPQSHKEHAERTCNLGDAYFELFLRTGHGNDLEDAIKYAELAARSEHKDKKHEPKMRNSLARMYHRRYLNRRTNSATAELRDLHEANRLYKMAIELVPKHRPEKAQFHSNYGTALETLYESSGDIEHLRNAIEQWEFGVEEFGVDQTMQDDPEMTSRRTNLGHGYDKLFGRTNDLSHQDKALDLLVRCLRGRAGTPFDRILAGLKAAEIAQTKNDWPHCADYLSECIELLPKVTLPTNSQEDLEHMLQRLGNLGPKAAAVYLRANRTDIESLQALDRCRTVIGGLLVDARSDVSLLEEQHAELAAEYKRLRDSIARRAFSSDALRSDDSTENETVVHAHHTKKRLDDVRCLDQILLDIRQTPGFANFQLALDAPEILSLASSGALIYFNITDLGSHAFLIYKGSVRCLSLPLMKMEDLDDALLFHFKATGARRDVNYGAKPGDDPAKQSSFKSLVSLLKWLWDVAVKDVLQAVNVRDLGNVTEDLPHIWWVGGGPMALLPLHAAGSYSEKSSENAMSHAVSSYATSLKTLHYSRARSEKSFVTNNTKILVVSMPRTPGFDDLDVFDEVAAIKELHSPPDMSVECLEYPPASKVVDRIGQCSIVHFACHASSDSTKPSHSALHLGNGDVEEKLSVKALQPLNHQLAQVAYLSACSTAEIGARNLIDESIHLASTFQLIGFRHVIGTLWSVDDDTAVEVATIFYKELFRDREEKRIISNVLHHALLSWRRDPSRQDMSVEQQVRFWAPFVHFGP